MALPPLPENNTPRMYLDYTSREVPHTLMVRVGLLVTPSQVEAFATNLSDAMRTRMMDDDAFLSLRYSNQGSDVSFPLSFVPAGGVISGSGNVWEQDPESVFLSLVGRSASGRKARLFFYTPVRTPVYPDNNRYDPADAAVIDTWRTNVTNVLRGAGTSGVSAVTIDGTAPTWNPYVNIAANAYWQREQRRGR